MSRRRNISWITNPEALIRIGGEESTRWRDTKSRLNPQDRPGYDEVMITTWTEPHGPNGGETRREVVIKYEEIDGWIAYLSDISDRYHKKVVKELAQAKQQASDFEEAIMQEGGWSLYWKIKTKFNAIREARVKKKAAS